MIFMVNLIDKMITRRSMDETVQYLEMSTLGAPCCCLSYLYYTVARRAQSASYVHQESTSPYTRRQLSYVCAVLVGYFSYFLGLLLEVKIPAAIPNPNSFFSPSAALLVCYYSTCGICVTVSYYQQVRIVVVFLSTLKSCLSVLKSSVLPAGWGAAGPCFWRGQGGVAASTYVVESLHAVCRK